MKGWVSIIAASAVLSGGVVAGLAATDAVSAPAAWSDPPARPVAAKAVPAAAEKAGPSCTPAAWPQLPAGCHGQGRPVRVIALTRS
ncbi:hypothetical protein HNR00_002503 [Methylorubrum rhodinum]|uniref:Uncharacterized protein n=1 Tax=Methylorubrum rhodinum TaxID=29428 RepID=A0A840ZLJ3_9HYPH|nr:hypothetical protein [Methylorubrum rhodinum]MBB5757787.1 hypothetical protein [Methylorubrum rhodinum]